MFAKYCVFLLLYRWYLSGDLFDEHFIAVTLNSELTVVILETSCYKIKVMVARGYRIIQFRYLKSYMI